MLQNATIFCAVKEAANSDVLRARQLELEQKTQGSDVQSGSRITKKVAQCKLQQYRKTDLKTICLSPRVVLQFLMWTWRDICAYAKAEATEQEHTKFENLRRGITKDFQRWAKF